MSLFTKKVKDPAPAPAPKAPAPAVTLESVQAENTALTEKVTELEASLKGAEEKALDATNLLAEYETLDTLQEQAYSLGFAGNVKELLVETKGDYPSALSAMIAKIGDDFVPKVEDVDSFLKVTNPSVKEHSNDKPPVQYANENEAYTAMVAANPTLSGAQVTALCMDKFPQFYDQPEGE